MTYLANGYQKKGGWAWYRLLATWAWPPTDEGLSLLFLKVLRPVYMPILLMVLRALSNKTATAHYSTHIHTPKGPGLTHQHDALVHPRQVGGRARGLPGALDVHLGPANCPIGQPDVRKGVFNGTIKYLLIYY